MHISGKQLFLYVVICFGGSWIVLNLLIVRHEIEATDKKRSTNILSLCALLGNRNEEFQTESCKPFRNRKLPSWIKEKYDRNMNAIWIPENSKLPEEVEEWWMELHQSKEDYKSSLDTLFTMLPSRNPILNWNSTSDNCTKCAVIGNSGNLKKSHYGKEIDAHRIVIRLNNAPIIDFEADVGFKTTHRIMYPESYTEIANDTSFILVSFGELDLRWLLSALTTGEIESTYLKVPKKIEANKQRIVLYNPTLMWDIQHNWIATGKWPSTGILAIFFALHYCDEVDVYGFGKNSNGYWDHYWESDDGKANSLGLENGIHSSSAESSLLTKLAIEGVITLKKR